MKRSIKGSISLGAVEAFIATAAYENYAEAGKAIGLSATQVMRRLRALEIWLHRVLIWSEEMFPTEYGDEFIPTAAKIIKLVDQGGLKNELSKTRVHPDGAVTIEGHLIKTTETAEIGMLMVKSRADLNSAIPAPSKVSGVLGSQIDMDAFYSERESQKESEVFDSITTFE